MLGEEEKMSKIRMFSISHYAQAALKHARYYPGPSSMIKSVNDTNAWVSGMVDKQERSYS